LAGIWGYNLEKQKRYLERIAFREGDKSRVVEVGEIDWIGAERGKVFLHTREGRHAVRYTLEELERRLDPCLFFRCHRSIIVNLGRIKEIIPLVRRDLQDKVGHRRGTRPGQGKGQGVEEAHRVVKQLRSTSRRFATWGRSRQKGKDFRSLRI